MISKLAKSISNATCKKVYVGFIIGTENIYVSFPIDRRPVVCNTFNDAKWVFLNIWKRVEFRDE